MQAVSLASSLYVKAVADTCVARQASSPDAASDNFIVPFARVRICVLLESPLPVAQELVRATMDFLADHPNSMPRRVPAFPFQRQGVWRWTNGQCALLGSLRACQGAKLPALERTAAPIQRPSHSSHDFIQSRSENIYKLQPHCPPSLRNGRARRLAGYLPEASSIHSSYAFRGS